MDSSSSAAAPGGRHLVVLVVLVASVLVLTVLTAAGGPARAQPAAPDTAVTALPRYDGAAATDRIFTFSLDDGGVQLIDRVRRNPRELRIERLRQNLFSEIGRPRDQPAIDGEILLAPLHAGDDSVRSALFVETSTGYVAYFDQLGRGDQLGEIQTTVGRPFDSLAARDGNFALLMHRGSSGRTVAATLYHATTGRALTALGIDDAPSQPRTLAPDSMPQLAGRVTAVTVSAGGGQTIGHILVDGGSGQLHDLSIGTDGRMLGHQARSEDLFTLFAREAQIAADQRFLALPVSVGGQSTRHLLLIDVGNGALGWLRDIDGTFASPSLREQPSNLLRLLTAAGSGARSVAAVPHTDSQGATVGAWLLDGASRGLLYIESLDDPDRLSVGRVTLER